MLSQEKKGGEKMKKCKSCQKEIDTKAKKCPFCQTDQRKWFARHPILTGILVVFIIFWMSALLPKDEKDSTNVVNKTSKSVEVVKTPIQIDVAAFADEFDANQVAAEKKWKGQFIEFSAIISNITDTGVSFHNVATKDFSGVQISCRIKDNEQLLPLVNGKTITVRGIVDKQFIGVIGIDSCEVVK